MQSPVLIKASLLTSIFMTPAYGPGSSFGDLTVTRRTGVLQGGPGRCGLVLGDVREAACTDSAKEGLCLPSFHSGRCATARTRIIEQIHCGHESIHSDSVTGIEQPLSNQCPERIGALHATLNCSKSGKRALQGIAAVSGSRLVREVTSVARAIRKLSTWRVLQIRSRHNAAGLSGRRWRIWFPGCWPPSAAQTARADFPHAAFTKT